jgi:hypothetical protein
MGGGGIKENDEGKGTNPTMIFIYIYICLTMYPQSNNNFFKKRIATKNFHRVKRRLEEFFFPESHNNSVHCQFSQHFPPG